MNFGCTGCFFFRIQKGIFKLTKGEIGVMVCRGCGQFGGCVFLRKNIFFTGLVLVGEIVVLGVVRPKVPKGIANVCRVMEIFVVIFNCSEVIWEITY